MRCPSSGSTLRFKTTWGMKTQCTAKIQDQGFCSIQVSPIFFVHLSDYTIVFSGEWPEEKRIKSALDS